MSTIGLDSLFYAPITENATGEETYGTPVKLAKAISCELSVELAEAILYADDAAAEVVKAFKEGKLTLGVDDIGVTHAKALTGAEVDSKGVLVSSGGTASSSECPRPIFRPRATASRFRRRPSRARSCSGTKRTAEENTRGKRK